MTRPQLRESIDVLWAVRELAALQEYDGDVVLTEQEKAVYKRLRALLDSKGFPK
jgi:hypothetical protein